MRAEIYILIGMQIFGTQLRESRGLPDEGKGGSD
jgi:hypothetical protein